MKDKNSYSIDKSNRLVIRKKNKRLLADGRFSIDKNNQLIYWLNTPASWQREYDLPNKISFKGNWQLNKNYDLVLTLIPGEERYKKEQLVLKGEVVSVDRDTLVFEIKSYDKQGLLHIQLLKLSGFWRADEFNRITFLVKKKMQPDILTLEGIWQINQNQQIIYTYEKTSLKTKTKSFHTLTFEGFWELNSANRLTYILTHSLDSRFDFRVQIESPNLYPKEGVIKYRLGIGLRQDRTSRTKIISLYGRWKFNRKLGLNFEMDYGKDRVQAIEFGADIYLAKKDKIIFSLSNKRKEPLGFYITFTHRFLRQESAEVFLRLKKLQREAGIEAGLRIPF